MIATVTCHSRESSVTYSLRSSGDRSRWVIRFGVRIIRYVCCLLAILFSAWPAIAAPRLAVTSEGVAFGEVPVGSNVVGKVVLRNEGSATVSVSRVKACCGAKADGAKAELSAMKIPPNGCECCQCASVASSNVTNIQLGIGNWNWILATMATFPKSLFARWRFSGEFGTILHSETEPP